MIMSILFDFGGVLAEEGFRKSDGSTASFSQALKTNTQEPSLPLQFRILKSYKPLKKWIILLFTVFVPPLTAKIAKG